MITKANDPANPTTDTYFGDKDVPVVHTSNNGMTKREMIAMHVLAGILARDYYRADEVAANAVRYADALIDALNRTEAP